MFIAMNRFKVKLGNEAAFEKVWRERDSRLAELPGFVEFHLLRGPEKDGGVLYSSHSIWTSRAAFEAWTKSDAFREAHKNAGSIKPVYIGGPRLELFDVVEGL